jgi:MFS family permease
MVPLFAAIAQRLHRRVPQGRIAATGCALFTIGTLILLDRVGAHPAYAAAFLPGWLLAGAGVGLAMSTIMSSAAADLPPASAATGSGVVNTSRQVGTVLGVSVLVAVLGTGQNAYAGVHATFVHAWWVVAGVMLASALTAFGMSPSRHPRG